MQRTNKSRYLQFSWFSIFLLLTSVTSINARADLHRFFTGQGIQKYFPYRNHNNGCKDHVAQLESSYKEAADLIDAAVGAIADMKQKAPYAWDLLYLLRSKERWEWDRKAESMTSMFGVRISSKGGPIPQDVAAFNYVERIFNQMKAGMDDDRVDTPTGGFRIPALYCGSEVGPDAWHLMQPTDTDPNRPGHIIMERDPFNFHEGAWYFNYNYIKLTGSTPTDPKLCTPDTLALTLAPSSFITWCDLAWTELSGKIVPGDVRQYGHLDDPSRNAFSGVWVHELAHFYGSYAAGKDQNLPDQFAVDVNGNPVFRSDGTPALTYGVERTLLLAKKDNDLATRTADAYCWFAVAMYLSDWNWSGGFASKFSRMIK